MGDSACLQVRPAQEYVDIGIPGMDGYRLARKLYLEDNSIVAEYTQVNLAPFEFRFIWAQHALLAMNSPVELDLSSSAAMTW